MEIILIIAAILELIILIVFFVIGANVGALKRTLNQILENGYTQYTCGHQDCKSKFIGKQSKCPVCNKKITW